MIYKDFIACVARHQTEQVKVLYFESCCSTTAIPNSILGLVPNLIRLLQEIQPSLCKKGQIMHLFGLQPCAIAPYSSEYKKADSRVHTQHSDPHLCCVLKYLLLYNHSHQPSTWSEENTIVIDFTTGEVMDNQRYLSLVFNHKPEGISYGMLYHSDQDHTRIHAAKDERLFNTMHQYYDC